MLEDLHHHERPTRIDIYADGSWLFKGKLNPAEAGGWGAVVVEAYPSGRDEAWMPSGATSPAVTSSNGAEIEAAINALKAVKIHEEHRPTEGKLPPIVLHTDQQSWASYLATYKKDPEKAKDGTLKELAQLATEMNVEIEYKSHNKGSGRGRESDSPYMDVPHQLASRASWRQRIEKQHGRLNFGPTVLEADSPEDRDKLINRIFPVKMPPRER